MFFFPHRQLLVELSQVFQLAGMASSWEEWVGFCLGASDLRPASCDAGKFETEIGKVIRREYQA